MNITIIGLGSIGRGLVPLLRCHLPEVQEITVLTSAQHSVDKEWEEEHDVAIIGVHLEPGNYRRHLTLHLKPGDILLNVSVNVSSKALIEWCQANGVMYLDTCVEPWDGEYQSTHVTNAQLRKEVLSMRRPGTPTAVVAHGANPGLVTHLLKQALNELAVQKGIIRCSYAQIAEQLGIKVVQVAERDTQSSSRSYSLAANFNTFVGTWSTTGLIAELYHQYAEIGVGSHEVEHELFPIDEQFGPTSSVLARFGADVRVKSWAPSVGEQEAYLLSHHESISIAELLTDHFTGYRPTVYYAYRPCPATLSSIEGVKAGRISKIYAPHSILYDPESGADELGVLLVHDTGSFWYGSTLDIDHVLELAPYNNATSLQVNASIMAAVKWMIANPNRGVVEAEDMDHEFILEEAMPYLGHVRGVHTEWKPDGFDFKHFHIES